MHAAMNGWHEWRGGAPWLRAGMNGQPSSLSAPLPSFKVLPSSIPCFPQAPTCDRTLPEARLTVQPYTMVAVANATWTCQTCPPGFTFLLLSDWGTCGSSLLTCC